MDIPSIEAYLKVKRLLRLRNGLLAVSVLLATAGVIAMLCGAGLPVTRAMAYGLGLGGLFIVYAYGGTALTDRLLQLIDRQINRDPQALRYLAQRAGVAPRP